MSQSLALTHRRLRLIWSWAIALTLLLVLIGGLVFPGATVAQTKDKLQTAPVVVDGQPLFSVAEDSTAAAIERATDINGALADWITKHANQASDPNVVVEGETQIILDGQPLLSVTEDDQQAAMDVLGIDAANDTITQASLAEDWSEAIQAALTQAQAERTPQFLRQAMVLMAIACILAALAHWWLRRLQHHVLRHPLQELQHFLNKPQSDSAESSPPLATILTSLALMLARVAIWLAAGFYIINLFPVTRDRSYDIFRTVMDSLFSPIFPLGNETYSITDLIVLIGVFFCVILGATVVANLLRSRILQVAGLGSGSQEAIAALTRYTLIAIGSVVVLQIWGLDLSSLTLLASALGVGIGFGFQNIARDFGSGLILLFERPVQVGDFIEVGEYMGTVDRIGSRSTSVKTLDQVSIIVPNSYFLENQVINWSHENPLSRIRLPVGVSYSSDPERVRTVLIKAAEEHPSVVRLPRPQVFFKGFGDSSLDFALLVWIVEPNRQPIIKSDLYFRIFALFREEGIEIPFPQRDLHIRSGHLPVALTSTSNVLPAWTPSHARDSVRRSNDEAQLDEAQLED